MAYDDEQGFQLFRKPVAEFLCRDWDARHTEAKRVAEFEFIYCTSAHGLASNTTPPTGSREKLVHLDRSDL